MSSEDLNVLSEIRSEIEATEGRPLAGIELRTAEAYIPKLNEAIGKIVRSRPGFDPLAGKVLLEELQQQSGTELDRPEPDVTAKKIFENAVRLLNQGDHADAEREFRKAIELEPSYVGVLHNSMVRSFAEIEDWQRAINAMRFVLWVDPNYSLAKDNLAIAYLKYGNQEAEMGNLQLATDIYSTALCIDASPNMISQLRASMAASFTSLGIRAREAGDLNQSWKFILRACDFYPTETTRRNLGLAYTLYAISLIELNRPEEAIYYFEQAAELGFLDAVLLNNYGVALATLGHITDAERKFERARELSPDDRIIEQNILALRTNSARGASINGDLQTQKIGLAYDRLALNPHEYLTAPIGINSEHYVIAA